MSHITTCRTLRPNLLRDLGVTSGSSAISWDELTYKKGAKIYSENGPAEHIYQVKKGAVRSFKLLSDGRRQIGAFHLDGDIFGLENGSVYRFTAEAVAETTVRLINKQSIEAASEGDPVILRNLTRLTTSNLEHAENHMLLLGRKSSLEKVAAFLIEMDLRLTFSGVVALPMHRRDIADYLGLTLETVSRALSRLQRKGVLAFIGHNQRAIVLRDRQRLAAFDLPA